VVSAISLSNPIAGVNLGTLGALPPMTLQPITYRGKLVACATGTRCILSGELDSRPAGDSETTFVLYMCAYAGDVLRGELPGPYTDQRAREFARAALIPEELLERPCPDPQRTSIALGIPLWELTASAPARGEGRNEQD
jgi:hypothetical protein